MLTPSVFTLTYNTKPMKRTILYFKQQLTNYWHFALLIALIALFFYRIQALESVSATLNAEKPMTATLAISKREHHHKPYKDWSNVVFETPMAWTDTTTVWHDKFSAWYKIEFENFFC